ncbi:MAG: GHMP kinase [Ruminococcaceae bacterium]|nr:GHMP kinase [Oscillospiraceae bacterium]
MASMHDVFEARYPNVTEIYEAFCPYRVCPLGAHSDHQHGLVTGLAISYGIHVLYTPTDDGEVSLHSMNVFGDHNFNINKAFSKKQKNWSDYIKGAIVALRRNHEVTRGLKAVVNGTLPIGGLSSSAALTIAFLSALCKINNITLSSQEVIDNALWAENHYVGVKCGKLDQSCEVLSKKGKLLYLDTNDDNYELRSTGKNMKPYKIAIFFSGLERALVGTAFNTRVDEMKSAAYALKAFSEMEYGSFGDSYLRDVPHEVFEQYGERLPESWRRRAAHFYSEYERVQQGVKAWRAGDIDAFGQLIFESGYSSIYNYETGSPELKKLYEIMCETKGIYGGRFSGAGFKGCCMALVDPDYAEEIEAKVTSEYLKAFPKLEGKFLAKFCDSADGCIFD